MKVYNKEIEELMLKLVSIQSDTGTALERDVEEYIYYWLSELDYFRINDGYFGKHLIKSDQLKRQIIWALVKGSGDGTIILYNHHDVVDSFDYADCKALAYQPERLKDALKQIDINQEVREDLNNLNWIFGRGTADMKAGTAIQMILMKDFSGLKKFNGNLLFISVPDEENLSVGMRNAPDLLEVLKEKYSLDYKFAINSEPHHRENEKEFTYFDGSVGKLLMSVYVKGKRTHIGDIFQGINPVYILSKIVEKSEMNVSFSDFKGEMVSPPPSWGFNRDFKKRYDVSVPEAAGGYISFLTLERTPESILKDMKKLCNESCNDILKQINLNYKRFLNNQEKEYDINIKVLTYEELMKEAMNVDKKFVEDAIKNKLDEIESKINIGKITLAESNFLLIKTLLDIIPDKNPVVVLSISPPYYPHINKEDCSHLDDYVNNIDLKIEEFNKIENGMSSINKKVFMGISDGSYFDFQCGDELGDYVSKNMPLWGKLYSIPFESMKKLSVPVINIGPWGKDIHKIGERVNRCDVNQTIPNLIKYLIEDGFKND